MITSHRPKPPVNILDQRVPRNPKYEHIPPAVDSGNSLTKLLKRTEEVHASGKQQAGEIFKRMKVSTLVKLIMQVAEINSLDTPKNTEIDSQVSFLNTDRPQTKDTDMSLDTARSTLQSVICGVGEMDVYKSFLKNFPTPPSVSSSLKDSSNEQIDEKPYLIVDIRDGDEFRSNHIISAHHYPASMLSRCMNYESKELLHYKNQKGKIIIVYDEDERISPYAAKILVERGYNNVFLLSGGLRYAVRKFPHGLLTGSCPLAWTLPNPSSPRLKRSHAIHEEIPVGHSINYGTQPIPGPMIRFDKHEQFTNHDIEELNSQLEKNSQPTDSGTRLSRATASKQTSRSSKASQQSKFSNISDKPWKP